MTSALLEANAPVDTPDTSKAPTFSQRLWAWAKRHPVIAAILFVAL